MSAVIQNEYTGNNSTTTYSFTFPYLKTSDIKASLDGVDTTAFTLPNATTLQFNTAPGSGVKIKIFRDTGVDDLTATFYAGSAIKSEDLNDNFTQNLYKTQEVGGRFISNLGGTMTGDLNMGEDTVIKFEGATDNAHETTLTVADPTADRTITFPNVTGTVVTTGDTGTVATAMIAGDAVTGAKIADDQINSEHYVDGSIDTAHIADAQITTAKIADSNVTTGKIASNAVTTGKIADGAVVNSHLASNSVSTAKIIDDAVTNAKIADNSIDSEHYVDGSIDNAHLADNSVTLAKMADDSVGTAELVDGSVDTARLADNSVTLAKMTDNSVGTSELVDAAVTTAKLNNNSVTTAKLNNNSVTTAKINDGAVTTDKLHNSSVTGAKIADGTINSAELATGAVITSKISNDAVTTGKIANDAINAAKIASGAVGSTEIGTGAIDTHHIADAQITTAKIADDAVTNAKLPSDAVHAAQIATGAVTLTKLGLGAVNDDRLASNSVSTVKIQSNAVTTSKIPDANITTVKIADSNVTLSKLASDLKQTTISDSDTQLPTSGAVVDYVAAQIAPIGGLEVIATEVAFPNTQPQAGVVISIADAGGIVVNGSGTSTTGRTVGGSTVTINNINSAFNSSTVDAGVSFMVSSTGSGQVYNFHKATLKESDILNLSNDINDFGNRYRVSSSAPTSSLDNGDLWFDTTNGKMMVYNSNTTAWEEVSAIGSFNINTLSSSGNTGGGSATFNGSAYRFTLSNPPQDAQQLLVSINGVIQKPNAGSSQPSEGFAISGNDIIFSAAPASGSTSFIITLGQSVQIGTPSDGSVSAAKIASGAVTTAKIADGAVTAAKIETLTGNVDFNDNAKARFGTGNDLEIYHSSNESFIDDTGSGNLFIRSNGAGIHLKKHGTTETLAKFNTDANNELYYDNSKKFETTSTGANLYGHFLPDTTDTHDLGSNSKKWSELHLKHYLYMPDAGRIRLGSSYNMQLFYDGSHQVLLGKTGTTYITCPSGQSVRLNKSSADNFSAESMLRAFADGAVELYYNNSKKLETTNTGVDVTGYLKATDYLWTDTKLFSDQWVSKSSTNGHDMYIYSRDAAGNNAVQAEFKIGQGATFYHNTYRTLQTVDGGIRVYGKEGGSGHVYIQADEGDDNADNWVLRAADGSSELKIRNSASGSWEESIRMVGNGAVELYYDNSKKLQTQSTGVRVNSTGSSHGLFVHHSNGNEVARLAHNGSGDEGVLVLKDGGSSTVLINGETNQNSYFNVGNGKIIIGGTASNGPNGCLHIKDSFLRLQASQQQSTNFSQKVGIEWSQEAGSDVQVGKIEMRRDAWGGAPHNMDFYTRTYSNGVTRALILHHNQNATLTGTLTQSGSDIRLKENITQIPNALTKVNSLTGFTYNWNKTAQDLGYQGLEHDDLQVGLSAQDVEKIQPEVIKPMGVDPNYKTIQYERLIPLLVESIKELTKKVEALEAK